MTRGVAIVTGSGSGIGSAIAERLAREGYAIGLLGRRRAALAASAELVRAAGGEALVQGCDISAWDEVAEATAAVRRTLGPVDVLVNNAGAWTGERLADIDPMALITLADTITRGTLLMTRAVLPGMIARRRGFILNIGSVAGLPFSTDTAAASAPKGAIGVMTRTLQNEVREHNVRVAVLHPDCVVTQAPAAEDRYIHISAGDVADVAVFMIRQPLNVLISELVMVPSGVEACSPDDPGARR